MRKTGRWTSAPISQNNVTYDYRSELDCAVRAANAAGAMLRRVFHSEEREIDRRAEEEIRQILASAFPQYGYRGEELGLVSSPSDQAGHLWLVDPDDGTSAFEKGVRGAAVSIALLRDGRPVLGVVYAYCAPDDAGDLFAYAEGTGAVSWNGELSPAAMRCIPDTILVSHHADCNPLANAALVAPLRFRAVPSIAYRLALVAAGEAKAAVSLNDPVGWDYAAGHAMLLVEGMDLYDRTGQPVRYDRNGDSICGGRCFGGPRKTVQKLVGQEWDSVLQRPSKRPEPYGICWQQRGCTVSDVGLLSRAQGCLLGQLAGDALGGLVEFKSAASIRDSHPAGVRTLADGGQWRTLGGQPTDDSEMALALARSIVNRGAYEHEEAARAYAWWNESDPFDRGNTIGAALSGASKAIRVGRSAAEGAKSAADRDSQANGALMRVSPLGILGASGDTEKVGEWAREDALLTHPNPVCEAANVIYAQTLAFAIRTGGSPEQTYRFALEAAKRAESPREIVDALTEAASKPPADYSTQKGWVLKALQNAFWQLLHATNLEEGVVNTVMSGGDTDTNAAIAGALLGAVHGRSALPVQWLDRILSCRPISGLAGVLRPRPEAFWPVDALWIAERLLWLGGKLRTTTAEAAAPDSESTLMVAGKGTEEPAQEAAKQSDIEAAPKGPSRYPADWQSRVRGCLLGGAIGDALGAPVEFMTRKKIEARFGPDGIADFARTYGRLGAITDDTQMTLFTAEGVLRAFVRERLKGICSVPGVVSHSYLRWLRTQKASAPNLGLAVNFGKDGWLWGVKELHRSRAPGKTCLRALASLEGFTNKRASNMSKGAGAIMRVAPVALIASGGSEEEATKVFQVAKEVSWITHGHPSGYLSAAAFAVMVHALLWGESLPSGIERAQRLLAREDGATETQTAIDRACAAAYRPSRDAITEIGSNWVGEEALAIAIYCYLTAGGSAHTQSGFVRAVCAAVNHDGDSDTTGSLVGQLVGSASERLLPDNWLENLELRETITKIADDLAVFHTWDLYGRDEFRETIWARYPGW
jgi:ADP-ribosylglycohydrolase/fructose-1,6-bisphosphatase/inositol monophosphatase family enzyme